jgi:hypothetical protein
MAKRLTRVVAGKGAVMRHPRVNREGEIDVRHVPPVGGAALAGYRVVGFTVSADDGGPLRAGAKHTPLGAGDGAPPGWDDGTAPGGTAADMRRCDIEAQLRRAGETLTKLPVPREVRGLEKVCGYIEVIRDRTEHGAWDRPGATRRRPTSAEIAELDQVLGWIMGLDADERAPVFLFALGWGVRRAAREIGGVSYETVRKRRIRAIDKIVGWQMSGAT